ncbi:MAG TPA: 2-dehydropantoate 2-reductase N-terminal domain-containing protein [Candidatus Binatia bacterium]|nr:2-dehydropantoate 2-reductase N-terminal domain-containing protein [Candidatus Binatia bacterium]
MSNRMIVIGTGPIGGIIGGRLARAANDITFVDVDREHVTAIREKGLQVDVPDGPFNVRVPIVFPGEIQGEFDIGFIAVRSNYTPDAVRTVMPHLSSDGLLVSLQNGINPPLLEEKVGPDRTVGVAIRMGSRRLAPGHVQTKTRGHLYMGHLHGRKTSQLENLHALLDSVIPSEISDNILGVLWSKLTYTCLGYFGSLADAALATSCANEKNRRMLVDFLAEVVAVGKAAGARFIPLAEYHPFDFHPNNPLEKRLAALNEMAKTWTLDDRKGPLRQLQKGITTEVDYTLAHVVREGEKVKISTPLCRKLLTMIHELETGKRKLSLQNYTELAGSKKP